MGTATRERNRNRARYARLAATYSQRFELQPPEREVLRRFRDHWPGWRMLDIGVGAGRTAYTFAAVTREYVGLDYVAEMVAAARAAIGEDDRTRFEVADARDLSRFGAGSFDFVLFSFNGIDAVAPGDRRRVLDEARRVLPGDGWFCFSSHNLAALPLRAGVRRPAVRHPLRSAYRLARDAGTSRRVARAMRGLDLAAAWRQGHVVIRDDAYDHDVENCYVDPLRQAAELEAAGFEVVDVLGRDARPVDCAAPGDDAWLYYLARAA